MEFNLFVKHYKARFNNRLPFDIDNEIAVSMVCNAVKQIPDWQVIDALDMLNVPDRKKAQPSIKDVEVAIKNLTSQKQVDDDEGSWGRATARVRALMPDESEVCIKCGAVMGYTYRLRNKSNPSAQDILEAEECDISFESSCRVCLWLETRLRQKMLAQSGIEDALNGYYGAKTNKRDIVKVNMFRLENFRSEALEERINEAYQSIGINKGFVYEPDEIDEPLPGFVKKMFSIPADIPKSIPDDEIPF